MRRASRDHKKKCNDEAVRLTKPKTTCIVDEHHMRKAVRQSGGPSLFQYLIGIGTPSIAFGCVPILSFLRVGIRLEVVLALGLVSFALVGILGLLFSGLTTFHRSIDQTVQSQIAQQVISNVRLTSYNNIVTYLSTPANCISYYDSNGNGSDANGVALTASSSAAIYTVSVALTNFVSPVSVITPTYGTNLVLQVWNKTSPTSTNVYSAVLVNET